MQNMAHQGIIVEGLTLHSIRIRLSKLFFLFSCMINSYIGPILMHV